MALTVYTRRLLEIPGEVTQPWLNPPLLIGPDVNGRDKSHLNCPGRARVCACVSERECVPAMETDGTLITLLDGLDCVFRTRRTGTHWDALGVCRGVSRVPSHVKKQQQSIVQPLRFCCVFIGPLRRHLDQKV